jgi:hypothetical protein
MNPSGRIEFRIFLTLLLLVAASQPAWSSPPVVVEETARIAPPESAFPLNGPLAVDGPFLIATSTILENGLHRSAVFMFQQQSASSWTLVRKLGEFGPVPSDDNHLAVDIDGQTAAIAIDGAVYVHEYAAGEWRLTATLTPPASATGFGSDVGISQDYIAVGGNSDGRVAAYVFQRTAVGQWVETERLLAGPASTSPAIIGSQLDIEHYGVGPRVALASTGRIHVFRPDESGAWIPLYPFGEGGPRLGEHISFSSPFIAFSTDTPGGAALAQEEEPDVYTYDSVDKPIDLLMNGPAVSVANSGGRIAVGEPQNEDRGANSGSVSVHWTYNIEEQDPVLGAKLYASDARSGLQLGRYVAASGQTVAASSQSSIYIFSKLGDEPPESIQDDFEDGDAQGWEPRSSGWSVVTDSGSRVYRQSRTSGTPLSLVNDVDWANQAIQADIRPLAFEGLTRWAGMVVRYIDDDNYYYVALRKNNRIELVRRRNGVNTTLAGGDMTVATTRSYRVRLEAIGTWLRVYVDAARVLQARDSQLPHGGLGLRTAWAQAQYDNVVVSPNPLLVLLYDNFEDRDLAGWTLQPGPNWANVASGSRVLRQSTASGEARATAGIRVTGMSPRFSDQVVEARVRPLSFDAGDSWVGLFARDDDTSSYQAFVFVTLNRGGSVSLRRREGGVETVLATAPLATTVGAWRHVKLEAIGRQLRVYVDGRFVFSAPDPTEVWDVMLRPRYGLITSGARAEFDNVRVTWP